MNAAGLVADLAPACEVMSGGWSRILNRIDLLLTERK